MAEIPCQVIGSIELAVRGADYPPTSHMKTAIPLTVTLEGGPRAVSLVPVELEDQPGTSPKAVGFVSATPHSQDNIGLWDRQLGADREAKEAILERASALARRQPR